MTVIWRGPILVAGQTFQGELYVVTSPDGTKSWGWRQIGG
jgi:hypothetical protein